MVTITLSLSRCYIVMVAISLLLRKVTVANQDLKKSSYLVNLIKDKKMKAYFLKTDISQYVIYPVPKNESLYFVLDIDSDEELEEKTPVLHQGKLVLVDKQPSPAHEWDGNDWVISPAKQTALLAERKTQNTITQCYC